MPFHTNLFVLLETLLVFHFISLINTESVRYENQCPAGFTFRCPCINAHDGNDVTKIVDCSGQEITNVPTFLEIQGNPYDVLLMNNTRISSLKKNAFKGLKVRSVVLDDNHLTTVFDTAFDESNGVEEISMQRCGLPRIPNVLSRLTTVKKINLEQNVISSGMSPRIFESLKYLEILILSHNKITFISRIVDFTGFGNLTVFDISHNKLRTFSIQLLGNPTNLKQLLLSHNKLKSLGQDFSDAPNLERLDLSGNQIFIPEGYHPFDGLSNLRVLKLSHCELSEFTARLFNVSANLKELSVAHCAIDELATNPLASFTKIDSLDVSGIETSKSQVIFGGIYGKIVSLTMSSMNLTKMPTDLLKKFPSLRKIKLNRNKIESLEKDSFIALRQPNTEIHLEENRIKQISPEILSGMKLPVKLFLANNEVTDVSFLGQKHCTFDRTEIDLSGNPLQCDCKSVEILQRKLTNLKGACIFQPASGDQVKLIAESDNGYTFGENNTLEIGNPKNMSAAVNMCNLPSRETVKYSCCSNEWVSINTPITCPVSAAVFPVLNGIVLLLVLGVSVEIII